MPLIDTHTHLDFDPFDADRGEVLARCASAGVERVLVLGVHQANWDRVWQMALDEPEPQTQGRLQRSQPGGRLAEWQRQQGRQGLACAQSVVN